MSSDVSMPLQRPVMGGWPTCRRRHYWARNCPKALSQFSKW